MKQFLLPDDYKGEENWTFSEKDFHYLCRVRRLKAGACFPGRDRAGDFYTITLTEVTGSSAHAEIKREEKTGLRPAENLTKIILYQCFPKGKKMDLIVRQAVEAGIDGIVPVLSERTVVNIKELKDWKNKKERLLKIMKEAAQQSGAEAVPFLKDPVKLTEITKESDSNCLKIFFHEVLLSDRSLFDLLNKSYKEIRYFIGPEGGFSPRETVYLRENGYYPVFLGKNVLRTETAALYGAAVLITLTGGE